MSPARRLILAAAAGLCLGAASAPAERLADPAEEARARSLFRQVRCLVCQNESIDDSEAELAADLRRVVREQIEAGRTDAEVRRFLTDRYGEFVLFRPSFSPGNALLWLAPFAVVLGGAAVLAFRRRLPAPEAQLSADEGARLAELVEVGQGPVEGSATVPPHGGSTKAREK